jgi:hypothetical protein
MQGSPLWLKVQSRLLEALDGTDIELLSSSRLPMAFGENLYEEVTGGYCCEKIARQMLIWLDRLNADDYIYCAEDDVLYCPAHFRTEIDLESANMNFNCFRSTPFGYGLQNFNYTPMSMFSAPAGVLRENLRRYLSGKAVGIELLPVLGYHGAKRYFTAVSNIDIRHTGNTTSYNPFFSGICDSLEYWGRNADLRKKLELDRTCDIVKEVVLSIQSKDGTVGLFEYIKENKLDLLKHLLDNAEKIYFTGSDRSALGLLSELYNIEMR